MKNINKKKILVACEYSGTVRDEFSRLGWDAWSCDLLPTESELTMLEGKHIQGDVLPVLYLGWDLIIAHPPCTRLTRRAQHWNKVYDLQRELEEAKAFFMRFTDLPCSYVAIENPIGIMSKLYQKPSQIVQPYQFGDPESKATCLWLKNLPQLIYNSENNLFGEKTVVEPTYHISKNGRKYGFNDKIWDKKERQKIRSKTFPGIARAMAKQWSEYILNQ